MFRANTKKKLYIYANEQFILALSQVGECCIVASEENDDGICI